jgi:hypothetical protein
LSGRCVEEADIASRRLEVLIPMARRLIAVVIVGVAVGVAVGQSLPAVVLVGGVTAAGFSLVWWLTESHVGIARRSADRLDHP